MALGYECAWDPCNKDARARSVYCSQRCYVAARRYDALTPAERAAREARYRLARERARTAQRTRAGETTRRAMPCVVCGFRIERQATGRISKYCSEACRHRRKRELPSIEPGAVAQFLRFAHAGSGARANAEEFYGAYATWARVYGVAALSPDEMLPYLKAAGFRVEGNGADQVVVRA